MEYHQYISDITFSGITPTDQGLVLLTGHEPPRTSVVDLKLTKLPFNDQKMKETLSEICQIPRMSTFAIGAIINQIVAEMPEDLAFVNVGVWHGFTLLAGMANNPDKKCVGIDNFSEFGGPRDAFKKRFAQFKSPNHLFFDMDYQDYFSTVSPPAIGFYIYDGDHSRVNQCKGLQIAEPFLAKDGLILVDDFNVDDVIDGTRDFLNNSSFEYKVITEQHTTHDWHPTFWNGIVLLQKLN